MTEQQVSSTRPREKRTLHFDLSHTAPGVTHTLHIGTRRYDLVAHTEETRKQHRTAQTALRHVPDQRLTHYMDAIELPGDAVQSYYVTHPHGRTGALPRLSLLGIHVPSAALDKVGRPLSKPGALNACKLRRLGLSAEALTDGGGDIHTRDLADFKDLTEAAKFIVFHHPELINLGTDTTATVLGQIENTRAFDDLVGALNDQGYAQGPDSDYDGWANGEYLLDHDGKKIPDGKGGFRWKYEYSDQTREYMTPVVQQALLAHRNDKTMDGISFATQYGIHNVRSASLNPLPTSGGAPLLGESAYDFKVSDPDWHHGRKVEISEVDDRTITFTVRNSYFRYLSVFARFLAYQNSTLTPIKLADIASAERPSSHACDGVYISHVATLEDRPRLMGIPIKDSEEVEFKITLPRSANAVDILCGGMGVGSLPDSQAEYENAHAPGAVCTGVINLGIPTFFLAFGLTSNKIESEGKQLIVKLAGWIVEVFTGEVVRSGLFAGGYTHSAMSTGWGIEIINSIIKEAPSVFLDLIAWAAAASAEEALEEVVPVVGAVWEAISVAATLAELAETVTDVALSPWVIPATVTSSLDLEVTIHPDKNNYQFPVEATQYKLVAHLTDTLKYDSGWMPFSAGQYDISKGILPTYRFEGVPSGGEVEVTVQFASDSFWIAGYGTTGKVPNLVPEGSEELSLGIVITQNPVPITKSTVYHHVRKLGVTSAGAHCWMDTATAPTATRAQLGGNMAVTLEGLTNVTFNMHPVGRDGDSYNVGVLGYAWQGKGAGLLPCNGGASGAPLFTMQSLQAATATPDSLLKVLRCGLTAPVMPSYDLLGPASGGHFVLTYTQDGTDPGTQKPLYHYHVRRLDLGSPGAISISEMPSWGRFASQKIKSIATHGEEFVLALSPDQEMVEILRLPDKPYSSDAKAHFAHQIGKTGNYVGRLHGAKAMAVTRDGNTFLVLEDTNNRIQAFSVNGIPVKYFGGTASQVVLRQWPEDAGNTISYLDMSLEYSGYIYVLSLEEPGNDIALYRLDIYNPDGSRLSRTRGIAAARLTTDQWRAVYTLNYEMLTPQLTNQRPEPSVSLWAA